MSATPERIDYSTFVRTVERLYRQLAPTMTPQQRMDHMADRYELLKGFKVLVLEATVTELLKTSSTMPTPHAMTTTAARIRLQMLREYREKHPAPPRDSVECVCGCGGKRWAQWLPPSEEFPDVPRTRDYVVCLKSRTNLPPSGPAYADERGVPVYGDPNYRRSHQ